MASNPRIAYRIDSTIWFGHIQRGLCLYIDQKRNIVIAIWVDYLVIAGKRDTDITAVKTQLSTVF